MSAHGTAGAAPEPEPSDLPPHTEGRFLVYRCGSCGLLHVALSAPGHRPWACSMTDRQMSDAADLWDRAAARVEAGKGAYLATPCLEGCLVLAASFDGDTRPRVAIGEDPIASVVVCVSAAAVRDIAAELLKCRDDIAARAEAEDGLHRHNALRIAAEDAARGLDDGVIAASCTCGQVHAYLVRDGRNVFETTMDPGAVDDLCERLKAAKAESASRAASAPKAN